MWPYRQRFSRSGSLSWNSRSTLRGQRARRVSWQHNARITSLVGGGAAESPGASASTAGSSKEQRLSRPCAGATAQLWRPASARRTEETHAHPHL